ncbi:MAG: sugar ABC transporter substrate-binding protein [Spirochaetota bacterium]
MKRKAVVFLALLVLLISLPSLAFAQSKPLTIGVVIPYEIGYFAAYHTGFQTVADAQGVKLVFAYHGYQADKEAEAVQNLISQGVDAINVVCVSPESAQYSCQLANEAGIPIQCSDSGVAAGKGKPIANIDFDWVEVYKTVAEGLRKDLKGDINVLWIQGFAGTPPVMLGIKGFKDTISKLKGVKLVTDVQDGQYATAPSLDITKTIIESGVKFNVAIGACQEITEGIIQGLKEENLFGKVTVVTVNGGPMDINNFLKGNLDFALSQSPSLHAMICAANLLAYMNKQPYQTKIYSPIVWVNKKDWKSKYISWKADESWLPVAYEMVKTGKYKPELAK